MSLNILVTGSEGYIGQRLIARLAKNNNVVGVDVRQASPVAYQYYCLDVRDPAISDIMATHSITHVVHLASVLQASGKPEEDYDIDINGTKNVLDACLQAGVKHITVTSSGAAYGYHADNPAWLTEAHPLRGNEHFAYSRHKRLVEEMLVAYRQSHPHLRQLVLRAGTVLGENTNNQITNLFDKKRLLAIKGSSSPFVFIWDEDVVNIIEHGVTHHKTGQFNLAGDGAMTIDEIAKALNKPLLTLPAMLLKVLLTLGHTLKLTRYSAEQIDFLRYRPVLSNHALKTQFGYTPRKTSREVFHLYLTSRHRAPL